MRLIHPILVVATVTVMAVGCTLITDVDRTEIPEKPSTGSGGEGTGGEGTGGEGTGGEGTGGEGTGGDQGTGGRPGPAAVTTS